MPRTSTKIMATFPIALPPLDEQRRIVDLIDALDDTIAATERSTQRSAALLDGLRNLTPTGDEVTVGEVVEQIVNGITTSASDQASGTGAQAIIKASAVQAGQFSPHETKWAADEVYDERYYVREGDVLMTRINTPERVGQLARVESTPSRPLIRPDLVWRIDLRPDRILPDYFVHAFSGSSGRRRVSAAASGTSRSMQQISKGRFSRVALVLPSLPQQEAYVARCEAARRVLKEHETASAGLRVCRSNLLTALLSGEHEIPESYDELTKESAA
jgi:type I restriction enzyme S subunit